MKKLMRVTFSWTLFKRNNLPKNGRYVTVAKFGNEAKSSIGAWSIIIEFNAQDVFKDSIDGTARFLALENVPETLLLIGKRFVLIEGNEVTANVNVVGEA
jgi:hypothetical protein